MVIIVLPEPRKGVTGMSARARIAVLGVAAAVVAGCGSSTTSPPGSGPGASTAAANTSSSSYKTGLAAGTTGFAEVEAFKGTSDTEACQSSFNIDQAGSDLNEQDYMAGCLYGLSHQSTAWTQGRK